MKTLIELYDERPIDNVLAAEVFHPEQVVFLWPEHALQDRKRQKQISDFFSWRGLDTKAVFLNASNLYTDKIRRQLERVADEYPDCAIELSGGSDAALFAAGLFCAGSNVPAITFSIKKQRYFNIHNAEFAEGLAPNIEYSVEDFFRMAGGNVGEGRAEPDSLMKYYGKIDSFFSFFLRHRKQWKRIVTWFQRSSAGSGNLSVRTGYLVKGERGSIIPADESALEELEKIGFIHSLKINGEDSVSFIYDSAQVRFWLRDAGAVLELYIWKACLDTGMFNDVRCSTVIRWDDVSPLDTVINEIDVTASKGIIPVFISCKTCPADTDAINELAILRDRFGGEMAKAIIVSTENCRAVTRHRASSLGIDIVTLEDLRKEKLSEIISELTR